MKFQSFLFAATFLAASTHGENRQHFKLPSTHPFHSEAPAHRRLQTDRSFVDLPEPLQDPGARTAFVDDETYLLCYYENWARYQRPWTQVDGKDSDVFEQSLKSKQRTGSYTLDPHTCTHIMYGFLYVNPVTHALEFSDPWADLGYDHVNHQYYGTEAWRKSGMYNVLEFKNINKKLRLMASVGGWNYNSCDMDCYNQGKKTAATFSEIAASEQLTRKFARNALTFLKRWHFDGLDLDWEYPAVAGRNDCASGQASPEDRTNFVLMIRRIKEEFAGSGLLVTAAVGVGINTVATAYDIPAMAAELDLISLMTYDMHGGWEEVLSFNAPLQASAADTTQLCDINGQQVLCMGGNAKVSTEWAVEYWLAQGVPADKLTVGVPTYGRGFTMQDANCHTPGSCRKDHSAHEQYPADDKCAFEDMEPVPAGSSAPTEGTKSPGLISYYEVADRLQQSGWVQGRSAENGQVPYIYNTQTRQWFGYDDQISLQAKMDYIKSKQVRGAMVWALSTDDTRGDFHDEAYPLLNTIKRGLAYQVCTDAPCGPVVPVTVPTAPPSLPPTEPDTSDCCPQLCLDKGCGPPLSTHRCVSQWGYCGVSDGHCLASNGGTDCSVCAEPGYRVCGAPTAPPTTLAPAPTTPTTPAPAPTAPTTPAPAPTDPTTPAPAPTDPTAACPDFIEAMAPCMPSAQNLTIAQRAAGATVTLDCPAAENVFGSVDFRCDPSGVWAIVDGHCDRVPCSTHTRKQECVQDAVCAWRQKSKGKKKRHCVERA